MKFATISPLSAPMESTEQYPDVKPMLHDNGPLQMLPAGTGSAPTAPAAGSRLTVTRKHRCPACDAIFTSLKEKRNHLVQVHNYQPNQIRPPRTKQSAAAAAAATTIVMGSNGFINNSSTSTITSAQMAVAAADGLIRPSLNANAVAVDNGTAQQAPQQRLPRYRMQQYLLNYNWSVLRNKLAAKVAAAAAATDATAEPSTSAAEEDIKMPILPVADNTYLCMVCKEMFKSIKAYDAHMSVHPAQCYVCNRQFRHWSNLSLHLKRHLNIRNYPCPHCAKKFIQRQNLIEHMNTHTGDLPIACSICSKRFRRYSNMIQHRNRYHLKLRPKEKDFICACGEVFHSEAKIAWHRETHEKKPKCCPYCRERFMHRNSLSRHVRLSHNDRFSDFSSETVECTLCHQFYKKSSLKAHMASHTSTTQYDCNICDKSFTTKWNMKQHKWVHASRSSKPFKCTVCPKAFVREVEYTAHVNTHKSIKPYTCNHCGRQFARKYNWLRHTREHERPKGFRCEDCGKVFHRAYYVKEHRRSHTGERPFECIICGKTSATKTNHNKHVKIHHARDPLTAEG